MPATVYTFEEFVEIHGKPVRLGRTNKFVFPDGARTDEQDRRHDPPADDFGRLTIQRAYWQELADRAESDFRRLKAIALGESQGLFRWDEGEYGPNPRDAALALMRIREVAAERRDKLVEIDAQLGTTAEGQRRREEREAKERLRQEEADRRAAKIAEIEAVQL